MARNISEFFSPKALSCLRFFEKVKKCPFKGVVLECEMQEVKQGGDKKFALRIGPVDLWIGVNPTNAQTLAAKWGSDIDLWVKKKITISKKVTGYQGKEGFDLIPG